MAFEGLGSFRLILGISEALSKCFFSFFSGHCWRLILFL